MKIVNEADVDAPADDVFAALNEPERVVTCLPKAELISSDGDEHRGRVNIKVGPISAAFEGTVIYLESNKEDHTIVLKGSGADKGGNGDAEATVRVAVEPMADNKSHLSVETDLLIKGKFVQFGKGAVNAVANRMIGQFADNLAQMLTSPAQAEATAGVDTQTEQAPQQQASASPVAAGAPDRSTAAWWQWAAVFAAGCVEGWILTRAFGGRR